MYCNANHSLLVGSQTILLNIQQLLDLDRLREKQQNQWHQSIISFFPLYVQTLTKCLQQYLWLFH